MKSKKEIIICILKILEDYSDIEHPLTQENIIDHLQEMYGLSAQRQTISTNIKKIKELGFNVIEKKREGVYIDNRVFDESEVKYLIDGIYSSKYISSKLANKLADKIYDKFSVYKKKHTSNIYKIDGLVRTNNDTVLSNIEIINEAIKRKKVIKFKYISYDEQGKETFRYGNWEHKVSPYYLVNDNNYYLLCKKQNKNAQKNELALFRLEYIKDPHIDKELEYEDINTINKYKYGFDLRDYLNSHIYLFGGDVVKARLELKDIDSIRYVKEYFGTAAEIYKDNDKLMARVRCNEKALFCWALQYSQSITVRYPESLVKDIKDHLKQKIKEY